MVFGTRPLLKLARSLGACVLLLAAAMPAEAASIRLAWDPNPEPEVVGYLVYVGTTPGSYTQTFDVGNQTVFVYPYAVPGGTYYFAVAAYTAGWHVGARSVEVSAIVPGAPPAPPPGPGAPGDGSRRVVCLDSRTSGCYAIQHVASGLGEISSASRSPDGRLFFIENGDRVRLLAGDTLVAEPAVLEQSGARLGTVVVDPAFDVTGFVFVSRVVTLADGSRTLDVVRYRAVQGQLGEAATVLPGLPLPPDGDAPFAIDANGRIYVAIPAGADVYGGYVVRFEQDGTVPRDGVSSPIFAHGYPRPHALQWDAVHE